MQIFHWHSEALQNYSTGDIVAIGRDVEEARVNARAGFPAAMMERLSIGYMIEKYPDWVPEEYEVEEGWALLTALEKDIMKEPSVGTSFFIRGGE
jgi:hypothetical protein